MIGVEPPNSFITVWSIDEATGHKTKLFEQNNLVMYTWGLAVAKGWCQGNANYLPSTFYFEYENVAMPGDTVTVPTYARSDGLSYYLTLPAGPPAKDYLRLSVSGLPSISIYSGYEPYFTAPDGNVATFFAQTAGTTGQLGRPFASGSNSKVYGVALVATPVPGDKTKDVIIARSYFSTMNQQLKMTGTQIGVTWSVPFL